jgi:flagella basal body P-ring formation protein FlgA
MTIVKPGQKVKVLLKGKSISLNSTALARQGGKIGQIIDVYNQKTNKKISGLVIDFNTVMVNL